MLNELYQLSRTLAKQGLLPDGNTQRDVHKLGKFSCLYISLAPDGTPAGMRLLPKEETGNLWRHSKGNHCNFPGIRVQKPLLAPVVSAAFDRQAWKKADLAQKRELLRGLDYTMANPESRDILVKDWSLEQLAPVMENGVPELEALRRLLLRFPREDNGWFYDAFRRFLSTHIDEMDEPTADFCHELLVGKDDAKKGGYTAGCMCYFEIQELSEVVCPVGSPKTERALIRCLLEREGGSEDVGLSAFSGKKEPLVADKYPNPTFKVLGPAYLFSNNTGAFPTLSRYHMQEMQSFPAGAEQVQGMTEALSFLMADERRDKTWRSFPAKSSKKKPMLLLAWLEDDPACNEKLAQLLGEDQAPHYYETLCKHTLDYLKPKLDASPDTPVHLQLFETLDKGREQIAFSRTLTAQQLDRDVTLWLEGTENLPHIYFYAADKSKGKEKSLYRPLPPAPGAISKLLRVQYRSQCGGENGRVQESAASPLSLQQVYHLFLPQMESTETGELSFVHYCLEQFLEISGELLTDAGGFQTTRTLQPFTKDAMEQICTAVSLLGICLYRLNRRKEQSMKSTAFLLGRFLKLSDLLHKNYCLYERNGVGEKQASTALPRQLMGNAVFSVALQTPVEAMNRLAEKIRIYIGWADTNPKRHSEWILRLLGETAASIDEAGGLPVKFTPEEKAELLLGYLATVSKDHTDEAQKTQPADEMTFKKEEEA